MNKHLIIVFIIALLCNLPHARAKNTPNLPFTIIIDPGHGGKDPGAVFKNIKEKDIVLNIGLKLGNYIKNNMREVNVIYTRNKDVFVPLHQRAKVANKNKADLFISLHANSCGSPSVTGTETFVLGLHRSEENLAVAKKENAVILMEDDYSSKYEGFDPNSSESYIMFEMVQDEYLDQSINIAAEVQKQFKTRAYRKDRGVKQAGFLVLRRTSMPSILIEAGFLSNHTEAHYLNSNSGQANIASAIYRAIRDYKAAIDNKSDYKLTSSQQPETPILKQADKGEQSSGQLIEGIHFRIQLAATRNKVEPTAINFKGLTNIKRKQSNAIHKYYYGKTNSYKMIQQLKSQIKTLFPDAFIVAFDGNKIIPIKKALRKIKP